MPSSAIDNLTRRLIEEGQRPVTVGLWFSLGHSTVVVMTCIVIAATSAALADKFDNYKAIGGVIGTSISMSFLLLIGFANCFVLHRLFRAMRYALQRRRLAKEIAMASSLPTTSANRNDPALGIEPTETIRANGLLFRLFSRLFKLIDRPYKMYPLGILFGLGFDTSTEIALLGIASLQGSTGTPIFLIMVFPVLFTVGMLLIDTLDGAGMYLAYTSSVFAAANDDDEDDKGDSIARLYYALVLTGMSVLVALTIGMIQMFSLILNTAAPQGPFWDGVALAGDKYDVIGGSIVGLFALVVLVSAVLHWTMHRRRKQRRNRRDRVEGACSSEHGEILHLDGRVVVTPTADRHGDDPLFETTTHTEPSRRDKIVGIDGDEGGKSQKVTFAEEIIES